jgi:hypothetical protein
MIIVVLFILYNKYIYSSNTMEGLENKNVGYVTKMKMYHNKNIARPFRKYRENVHKKITDRYNKLKKILF